MKLYYRKYFLSFFCIFNLLIAIDLSAKDQTEDFLEEVSVIGERVPTASESAWSIDTLSGYSLNMNPAEHIQQALNRVAGVNLQRGNGMEYLPALRSPVLTGSGACGNMIVMEQGVRVRGSGNCNINELFDVHFEQASQIDIFRSPTTAFHGANAIQGALDIRLGVSEKNSLSLDVSDRGFKRIRHQNSYKDKNHQGSLYLTLTDDDAWREQSDIAQQKFSWRHEYKGEKWALNPGATLINLNQETAGFIVGKDAYKDQALSESNPTPEAYRDSKAARFWVHAKKSLSDHADLLITPYLRYVDMDFLQHFLPGDPLEKNQQKGIGVQSSVHQNFARRWRLNYGVDFEFSEFSLLQTQDLPTTGSAFLVETIPVGKHYDYTVDAQSLGLFFQSSKEVTTEIDLSLGARAEYNSYDYKNFLPVGRTRDDGSNCGFGGCRYNRPESAKDDFLTLSPNVSIAYTKKSSRLFASLGQNFRPPQTSELYRLQRQQNKADLASVKSTSLNLGFEKTYEDAEFKVEVYYQRLDNLIIRDVDFFNVDNAKAVYSGLDFTWHQQFNSWSSHLLVNLARHQYGDNQILGVDELGNPIDVSGNDIDTAPRWFGRWQLQKAFNSVLLQFEVESQGKYFLEPENKYEYEGHTLVNMNMTWSPLKNLELRLKVNNLFDQAYASRADFTGFSGYRYFPGEPRAFVLGITKSF